MGYIAGKVIQIQKADGSVETRKPGDPVPEAAGWKNLSAWLAQKRILHVPDDAVGKPTPVAKLMPTKVTVAAPVEEPEVEVEPKKRGRPRKA